jgi:glutathione S-transferase
MAQLVLYHGNKNYSSWSMRAWLALEQSGAEYEEVGFNLAQAGVRDRIREYSPTGRVPALRHGELIIWDSLAIAEYLAELRPEARLWPQDRAARAVARSICAEMHSSFPALRRHMPFNVRRSSPGKGRADGVAEDIRRVLEIWTECRARHDAAGPFLFGGYGLADIFFAPVVSRFETYAVPLDPVSESYAAAVREHPHVQRWRDAATSEPWVEPEYDL